MIISGGFNVFPSEVERVLIGHPAVHDCAVIGVPHEDWGEAVMAIVELKSAATLSEAELLAWAKERLTGYKVPKGIAFRDLPRSPVGKVLKRVIRNHYWKDAGRSI